MYEKLKPCPFCGSTAVEHFEFNGHYQKIVCNDCKVTVETPLYLNLEKTWNTRDGKSEYPIMFVEDGSVDLEDLKNLPVNVVVYRQGARLPEIISITGDKNGRG